MRAGYCREVKSVGNVADQVADMRERVAVIETRVERMPVIESKLDLLQRSVDAHNALDKKSGSVVIPVAAVVTALEIVKEVLARFF